MMMKKHNNLLIGIMLLGACAASGGDMNGDFTEVPLSTDTVSEQAKTQDIAAGTEPLPSQINKSKDFSKIQILLHGEEDMNPVDGIPQNVDVCVYELNWKQTFMNKAFSQKEKKKKELLKCEVFDRSVNKTTKLTVYPGKDTYFTIDRYKNLAHVAIVADYPVYSARSDIRLHNVPYRGVSKGWSWLKSADSEPYIATITHKFGPSGIVKIKRK